MIILTQPGISAFNPKKVSSTVRNFGIPYVIAEVNDEFNPTEKQMKDAGIDFWWSVQSSLVDASKYKLRKYAGGIVEGVMEQLSLSKEINIAYGIYAISADKKGDEFQVWEKSILKP